MSQTLTRQDINATAKNDLEADVTSAVLTETEIAAYRHHGYVVPAFKLPSSMVLELQIE